MNFLVYNPTLLFFVLLASISVCCSLNCGNYTQYTSTFFLCDGGSPITSPGEVKFQIGFFTPKENLNRSRYIGIWYKTHPETIVWVANRDKPLPENSFGSFGVLNNGDGNLKLKDASGNVYFSTNISSNSTLRMAKLKEGGNLILADKDEEDVALWQSFDHPTDTFLPGMKMTKNLTLNSWRTASDPSTGKYRFVQDEKGVKNGGCVVMNGTVTYWKGKGQSNIFTTDGKMAELTNFLLNYNPILGVGENRKSIYNSTNSGPQYPNFRKMRLVMNHSGEIQRWEEDKDIKKGWEKIWGEPESRCGIHTTCGKFGVCTESGNIVCRCMEGFKPVYENEWNSGDYSRGCISKSDWCGKEGKYRFLPVKVMDVEEQGSTISEAEDEEACIQECLDRKCECYAYFYRDGDRRTSRVCFLWTSELVDIKVGYDLNYSGSIDVGLGINISVRVGIVALNIGNSEPPGASVETPPNPSQKALPQQILIISITFSVIAVVLLLCSLSYIFYRRNIGRRRESSRRSIEETRASTAHLRHFSEEDKAKIDVPFFTLESILAATNSFSDTQKLGEGGFGPVYKGKFHGEQEIAVKRLSVNSMQGLEELKNEVVLIAKLQHRNLVKLLGYCIEGDESILLYEFMPNKSLDTFIFDQTLSALLNWEIRFEIILGVARGLLYLHQDSRLRVIHRDLKVSNILLDEDMNPKISDFGLARIVGGEETEANTNRVVGTYGYMSPEYALEGIFSIKSDVFSFGVVVLEIISGKKNTGFYKSQHDLNLLGHAWRMWKEDNPMGLIDKAIAENCNRFEVLKCIIIGLLCVQEDPSDRPNMYNVVYMLGSEIGSLPNPKQPAFVGRTNEKVGSSSDMSSVMSNNQVTLSRLEPR